jgi:hypothetical protein
MSAISAVSMYTVICHVHMSAISAVSMYTHICHVHMSAISAVLPRSLSNTLEVEVKLRPTKCRLVYFDIGPAIQPHDQIFPLF